MTVTIVEVIRRAEQGVTEPFICRGNDREIYYVKGHSAGRESQIKELICGRLALALHLPIAPFEVVDVPEILINSGLRPDLASLGAGPAFGSRRRAGTEVTFAQLDKVPKGTGQDVLMFDWWIRNTDRNLTALGGNPNLLWDQAADRLVIIDHNLAFDPGFEPAEFAAAHVFHHLIASVFEDWDLRQRYVGRFKKAVTGFRQICDNIPGRWVEEAPDWFDLGAIEDMLRRCDTNGFWTID
jgi:hypothetical protein